MKNYDVIVIGSGSGMLIVDEAIAHGLKVALVDKGPLGGTCLNSGCIPSKMLIYAADKVVETEGLRKLGIEAHVSNIDFGFIMDRMRNSIQRDQAHIREALSQSEGLDFYKGEGRFVRDYVIEVDGQRIKGKNIFIASGSRPFIPPIKGLDSLDYLTNETVLQLKEKPRSLIIIGGGYIGVEYAHFFAAMGTKVTIVEMLDRLVAVEEPEISELLRKQLSSRAKVYTGIRVEEVKKSVKTGEVTVMARDADNNRHQLTAQRIMVAVGRRSNADILQVGNTGVETDNRGFIKVNEYLETSKKNIFAVGDANGQQMFTHVANREAMLAADNFLHGTGAKMDYSAAPHAVYSHPQIASVGLREDKAKEHHKILVGKAKYSDVAKGEAMMEKEGFAKVVLEEDSGKILGFHIIGPYAPELIQEVTNAMASEGHINQIMAGMHIHPALSELVQQALSSLEQP
jgi:mycothione reductase